MKPLIRHVQRVFTETMILCQIMHPMSSSGRWVFVAGLITAYAAARHSRSPR